MSDYLKLPAVMRYECKAQVSLPLALVDESRQMIVEMMLREARSTDGEPLGPPTVEWVPSGDPWLVDVIVTLAFAR